jgi:hypothetical protein
MLLLIINYLINYMRNVEKQILTKISRERGESNNPEFLEKIQSGWNKLRPKLKDFRGTYPAEEISADADELEKIKENFEFKGETAIVGEAVIMEAIYELEWLGRGIEVLPSSEYDDIKNGIDFVLRFENKDKALYLGIDVTTSTDSSIIKAKRERILNFLRKGNLGQLKYFEDQKYDIKGEIEMPKIAIVLDPNAALKMQDLLLKIKEHKELSDEEKAELEKIRASEEKEVIDQLQENIQNIKELIKQTKYKKDKAEAEIKKDKYVKFLNKYREIYEALKEIKKEALN